MNYPASYYRPDPNGGVSALPFWIHSSVYDADNNRINYTAWNGTAVFPDGSGSPDVWWRAGTLVDWAAENGLPTDAADLAAFQQMAQDGSISISLPMVPYAAPALADASAGLIDDATFSNGNVIVTPGLYYLPDGSHFLVAFFANGGTRSIDSNSYLIYKEMTDYSPMNVAMGLPARGPGGTFGFLFPAGGLFPQLSLDVIPPTTNDSVILDLAQTFGPVIGAIAFSEVSAGADVATSSSGAAVDQVGSDFSAGVATGPAGGLLPVDASGLTVANTAVAPVVAATGSDALTSSEALTAAVAAPPPPVSNLPVGAFDSSTIPAAPAGLDAINNSAAAQAAAASYAVPQGTSLDYASALQAAQKAAGGVTAAQAAALVRKLYTAVTTPAGTVYQPTGAQLTPADIAAAQASAGSGGMLGVLAVVGALFFGLKG